jgi:hypothetical protein
MSQDQEAYARVVGMLDSMIADLGGEPGKELSAEVNAAQIADLLGSSPEYAALILKALGDVSLAFNGAGGVDGLEWAVYISLKLGERIGYGRAYRDILGPSAPSDKD